MRKLLFIWILFLFGALNAGAQTDSSIVQVQDTISKGTGSAYLDSMMQDKVLRKLFFKNEAITGIAVSIDNSEEERDLPRLKEIRYRSPKKENWKFWVIAGTLLFLATIRLSNIKRFDEQLIASANLQIEVDAFKEKAGAYLLNHVALFVNLLVSLSLFWVSYSEYHRLHESMDYTVLLWQQVFVLILIYIGKAVVVGFSSGLVGMGNLGRIVLYNTLVVGNFLGVVLVFLNLFYLYIPDAGARKAIEAVILITIFVSVIYRQIKNILMSMQSGKEQLIYIILYLCSLEIVPWLILLKIFLHGW